jgi:sugar O-acyltransferase (sialic acid O-acetyltransferase NeuD family)
MIEVVVIGSGGLAREFSCYFSEQSKRVSIIGFASTNHEEHAKFNLPGKLFKGDITPALVGTDKIVIAIGNPAVRKRISEKLRQAGFMFPSLIHPSSMVSDRAAFEEGVVVSPHCVVSPNVTLKQFCYLNFGVGVGHDAVIGAYVQINPGAQLGGFSVVGNETLIGSGATIIERVTIGTKATIAAGSVILAHVADGATMLGNPAKRMRSFEK